MIPKVILYAFYTIASAILMVILYNTLFVYDYQQISTSVAGDSDGTVVQGGKGALWVAADSIQNACSYMYFNYVYLPTFHQTDGVDSDLGITSSYYMHDTGTNYRNTPTNLSGTHPNASYNFSGVDNYYHADNY